MGWAMFWILVCVLAAGGIAVLVYLTRNPMVG